MFASPPLFSWEEPDAYVTRNYLVKKWPKALILAGSHLKVYEHQIILFSGKSATFIPFNRLAECVVTLKEVPEGKPYYLLTFIPKKMGFWGKLFFHFLKETALDDPVLLGEVAAYMQTKGVVINDSRKSSA